MTKGPKVDKEELLNAALQLMTQNGKTLTRQPSKGTAKIYAMPNGETVRARTCNDHIMIVVADAPTPDAGLNIEGTDWVMLAMPEVPRTAGSVVVYLLPTHAVVDAARRSHAEWLDTAPNTKGQNTTWNLWFDNTGGKSSGYAEKWAKYRLPGTVSTIEAPKENEPSVSRSVLREEIQSARERISVIAGVPVEAVKVSIDFVS